MHTTSFLLPYSGGYDWPATLCFLAAHAMDGVEEVHGELYRRTVGMEAQAGLAYQLWAADSTASTGVRAAARAATVGA